MLYFRLVQIYTTPVLRAIRVPLLLLLLPQVYLLWCWKPSKQRYTVCIRQYPYTQIQIHLNFFTVSRLNINPTLYSCYYNYRTSYIRPFYVFLYCWYLDNIWIVNYISLIFFIWLLLIAEYCNIIIIYTVYIL